MQASVTCVPIHGDMFLSIKDIPKGNLTKKSIREMRGIFKGLDYDKIQDLLKQSQFSSQVEVGRIQKQ